MKTIWIIVAILVVLWLGWYFLRTPPSTYSEPTPTPTGEYGASTSPTPSAAGRDTAQNKPATVTVEMAHSGFSPNPINIKKGTTVVFTNKDTAAHWPASNPHPVHTDYPGFDALEGIPPGGTYSFTFNEVKSIGYHDHLNPGVVGKITVTK